MLIKNLRYWWIFFKVNEINVKVNFNEIRIYFFIVGDVELFGGIVNFDGDWFVR